MKAACCLLLSAVFTGLSACTGIKRTVRDAYRHELFIDYRYVSFQGQNSRQKLCFEIDSTSGIWYSGRLIIDYKDTLPVGGFAKGNRYVASYILPGAASTRGLKIWSDGAAGQIRDSLTIEEQAANGGVVAGKTVLYRKPRTACQ